MFVPRAQREELNTLSKEIFGAPSRWMKFLDKGTREVTTRKVMEVIPGVDGAADTEKEVSIPVLGGSGVPMRHQKYYTVESLTALLVEIKTQMDDQKAGIKKMQDEKAAADQVRELAQGSAL